MAQLRYNARRPTAADIVDRSRALRKPKRPRWDGTPVTALAGQGLGLKPLLIVGGRVIGITRRARCKLRHKHAIVWVRWFNDTLPAGVKRGEHVTVVGKLMTFNNGTAFQVLDAVLLTTSPRRILKELRKVLPELLEFPNPEDFAKAEPR